MTFLALPSPAKLNLFLHVLNQREDGYHNIQTVFQLIDFEDKLTFRLQNESQIRMITHHLNLPEADNIIIKAAKALQQATQCSFGCDIALDKKIPMGAGLGGGSSNAATTLLALNVLWKLGLTLDELAQIGSKLGADVAVFIHGYSAWAEGIGDQLTPLILPQRWYCLLLPAISISTHTMFTHPQFRYQNHPLQPTDYNLGDGGNDFEAAVTSEHPQINQLLSWARQYAPAHLTGTGSTVFAIFDSKQAASQMAQRAPDSIKTVVAKGLNHSNTHRSLLDQ